MLNETEFKIPNNTLIRIDEIIIKDIDVSIIKHIDIYIDNKKMYAYYRLDKVLLLIDPIYFDDEQLIKIMVETKNDEKVKVNILENLIIIHNK